MYQTENVISKLISTQQGENEFQIRYISDEGVGIVTTPTDKSYFILDSAEYWYDLIQERYPPIKKCSCKNDRFNLVFDYTPRAGTDDFKEINITCKCTACQKLKKLPAIKINYSPSTELFNNPITFCKTPKIKYKTHSLMGYWSQEELSDIIRHFFESGLSAYCWYWDSKNDKRYLEEMSKKELHTFLSDDSKRCLAIYFCEKSLGDVFAHSQCDENGIIIEWDIWRKESVFMLHAPFLVESYGMFYHISFCSEYLDKDTNVVKKSPSFSKLTQEFLKFSKNLFKK